MGRLKMIEAEESVACNLIPMIDIMFLLLLFFMLSADMVTKEMESVTLPQNLEQAVQDDDKAKKDYETDFIAVVHQMDRADKTDCSAYNTTGCQDETHWLVKLAGQELNRGTDWTGVKTKLKEIASIPGEQELDASGKPTMFSKRAMVLRADRNAPYGQVQKLIQYMAEAGLYKVEPGAGVPAPKKPGD